MSPYAQTLATARLDAIEALIQALQDAQTPDEKRRCAVAIFNAPDPDEIDDTIEWETNNDPDPDPDVEDDADDGDGDGDGEDNEDKDEDEDDDNRATGSPAALGGQPVPPCNTDEPPTAPVGLRPNSFPEFPDLAPLADDQILDQARALVDTDAFRRFTRSLGLPDPSVDDRNTSIPAPHARGP